MVLNTAPAQIHSGWMWNSCGKSSNPHEILPRYSRDEYKQFVMANRLAQYVERLRFFIGDAWDRERLYRAFDGVDYVVHAAALKQVPACEYSARSL